MRRAVLLSSLAALAGCQLLAGYEVVSAQATHDAAVDDRDAAGDGSADGSAATSDSTAGERAADAALACDLEATINAAALSCGTQCVDCANDQDGDGLPDARDADPAVCNTLWWSENFAALPDTRLWDYNAAGWRCGALDGGRLQRYDFASWVGSAPFVIEVRFELDTTSSQPFQTELVFASPLLGVESQCVLYFNQGEYQLFNLEGGCSLPNNVAVRVARRSAETFYLQTAWNGSQWRCALQSEVETVESARDVCGGAQPTQGDLSLDGFGTLRHVWLFRR